MLSKEALNMDVIVVGECDYSRSSLCARMGRRLDALDARKWWWLLQDTGDRF